MKYSFNNDYSEGAHPLLMDVLMKTNLEQSVGYGMDEICDEARKNIKTMLQCDTCDVHFLVGGTQANTTIIASALRPHECVISAGSGHINVHETGAIESSGHKVIIAESKKGKLCAKSVRDIVALHEDEHMVKPKMVYISNATEIGTIYYKEELKELSEVCKELGLYLFMDGARLGVALCASDNDLSIEDICNYVDVFYIGGTKNGALFGEAVVIVNDELKKDFRYMMKQRGGMLAKGRLLGIQFKTLLEDTLYFDLARHANDMAMRMQATMKSCGVQFVEETTTNQIFPILDNAIIKRLQEHYVFQKWEVIDEHQCAMRFVTSWATTKEAVEEFCEVFKAIMNV